MEIGHEDGVVLAIDLGGTKITTAVVDRAGRILARDYRETKAMEGPEAIIRRMIAAAKEVVAQTGVAFEHLIGIGIGSPGPLDVTTGVVDGPPNLPGWVSVPLRARIEDALGVRTWVENDANAAAVGEHRFGAGKGAQHMIYVTASTGIGGGLILNDQLYHGACDLAGEIGHMTVLPEGPTCACGNRGCLEALASGTAIARRARESVARGVRTRIAELAEGIPERITAKLVAQAAAAGDAEAQAILNEAMRYLGLGLASLVNLFNPQRIVIGGGLTALGDQLFETVRRAIVRHAYPKAAQAVQVVPAALGENVGVLGAAAVVWIRAGKGEKLRPSGGNRC